MNKLPENDIKDIDDLVKYYSYMMKISYMISKDVETSKEMISDFYVKYLRNPKSINRFYIYGSLKNIFISYIRKENTKRKYNNQLVLFNTESEIEYDTFTDIETQFKIESMMEIINREKFFNRELFKLNYFKKMSVRKIHEETKIPEKTIRFAITTTKKRLMESSDEIIQMTKEKILIYESTR